MEYRNDIDGLRAVAVILIVFFHVRLSNVPGGFVGVDVFFVISGYLITRLILQEIREDRFSFSGFYMRRLRRLGPALLVTVALTLAIGWFTLPPALYQDTAQAALGTLLSVSNIVFWMQTGYFDTEAAYKPLLHTWSLAVEEQFYLIWPASLLIAARFMSQRGIMIAVALISAISLAFSQALLAHSPWASFYLTPFRIFGFGAGAILAVTGWQARHMLIANAASLGGLMIIFYVAANLHETAPFPGLNAAVPAFATAMMIYAGPQAVMNRVLALPPIRYIGRISYSVYLLHWPLIVYYIFLYGQATTSAQLLWLIGLTLGAGALMYHLVESPFRRKRDKAFRIRGKAVGWGSLAAAIAIGGASWQINHQGGFPGRYPPEIRALLAELNTAVVERTQGVREFTCNATANSQDIYFDAFEDCLPDARDSMIIILGDSHAADLFMGLQSAYHNKNAVQLTGNGCNLTKALDEGTFCGQAMRFWKAWVAENATDIDAIIYSQSGASLITRGPGGVETPDAAAIDAMAATLAQYQIPEVPMLFWGPRPGLSPSIDIAIAGSRNLTDLRNSYDDADFGADFVLDEALTAYFAETPIHYVSSARALCAPQCPTLTQDEALFVVDYGHWTPQGAIEAVSTVVESDAKLQTLLGN